MKYELGIMGKDLDIQKEKIIQRFNEWALLKPKLHFFKPSELYFKERQIWWTSIGQNIGSEENGKHGNFERPVLIFKKFNKDVFLSMPISTSIKIGAYRYVFARNEKQFCLNVSQMRVLSSKRLLRLVGHISPTDFNAVMAMYKEIAQ